MKVEQSRELSRPASVDSLVGRKKADPRANSEAKVMREQNTVDSRKKSRKQRAVSKVESKFKSRAKNRVESKFESTAESLLKELKEQF